MALVSKGAGLIVRDADAERELLPTALALLHDPERIRKIESEVIKLALPDAAQTIVDEVYKLV